MNCDGGDLFINKKWHMGRIGHIIFIKLSFLAKSITIAIQKLNRNKILTYGTYTQRGHDLIFISNKQKLFLTEMLQNTFSFEIGFYWIKLICSLHKLMADLNSLCVKPSITKCKKLYEDCRSLSTSSFEAVANSLQGKEWKEDRISIFNIAYSFLPQVSIIQHRKN